MACPSAMVRTLAAPQQNSAGTSHADARLLFSLGVLFSPRVIKEKIQALASDRRPVEIASGLIRTRISYLIYKNAPHLREQRQTSAPCGRTGTKPLCRRSFKANKQTPAHSGGSRRAVSSTRVASAMMINHLGRRDLWKTSCAAH